MNLQQLPTVILRLFAVYMVVQAVIGMAFAWTAPGSVVATAFVVFALAVSMAVLLWLLAEPVSRRIAADTVAVASGVVSVKARAACLVVKEPVAALQALQSA